MKILMIGNSYTYFSDMPRILERLLRENGISAQVDSVTCGGRKLYENLNAEDAYHKRIVELCNEHKYDALILQEQSCLALVDYVKFVEGVQGCAGMVDAKRTILYATWGRKQGCDLLEACGWTNESMTEGLASAYDAAALKIGGACAHVGKSFLEIRRAYPEIEMYDPDLSHPSYAGSCLAAIVLYGALTGSLTQKSDSLQLDATVAVALSEAAAKVI